MQLAYIVQQRSHWFSDSMIPYLSFLYRYLLFHIHLFWRYPVYGSKCQKFSMERCCQIIYADFKTACIDHYSNAKGIKCHVPVELTGNFLRIAIILLYDTDDLWYMNIVLLLPVLSFLQIQKAKKLFLFFCEPYKANPIRAVA